MFSSISSLLALAILGSLIHRAISGPLDCISGPCVTVEGVGKPQFNPSQIQIRTNQIFSSQLFQFHQNLSQPIKFQPISIDLIDKLQGRNNIFYGLTNASFFILHLSKPISINLRLFIQNQSYSHLRQAPRQLGEHPMVSQENQPVHGNSFRRINSRRIQVLILSMIQHYPKWRLNTKTLCVSDLPHREPKRL